MFTLYLYNSDDFAIRKDYPLILNKNNCFYKATNFPSRQLLATKSI